MKMISELLLEGKTFCKKWLGFLGDLEGGESMLEELFNDNADKGRAVSVGGLVTDEQESLYQAPDCDYIRVAFNHEEMGKEVVRGSSDMKVRCQVEPSFDSRVSSEAVPSKVVFRTTTRIDEKDADTLIVADNGGNQMEEQVILQLPALLEELEMAKKTTDDNVRSVIDYCSDRICEILLLAGCEKIEGDSSFDSQCHVPSPFKIVPNGSRIEKTLQFGIKYHENVLKKAVVQIQNIENE